jgi:hypothetical protein
MIILLSYIIYAAAILPQDSILLPNACTHIESYSYPHADRIYCAPFTGTTIYSIAKDGAVTAGLFTGNTRERIVAFAVTPFAFFINNGETIVRYFRSTMASLEVITATKITSFAITPSEEIIFANTLERALYLFDYTGEEKTRIEDIMVRDMVVIDTLLYVLTPSHVVLFDLFGNVLEQHSHNGSFNGLRVHDDRFFLFARGQQEIHVFSEQQEHVVVLPVIIQEIAIREPYIYVLDERGTVLYRFHSADF